MVAVALLAVVAWFWFSSDSKTLKGELSDFSVEDTAAVDKLFLADKLGHTALLERTGPGTWKVGEYLARPDAVNLLLTTLKKMVMRAPVAKSMEQKVLRDLSGPAQKKIEIYSKGTLLKTIFVGTESMDKQGTFMLIDGSSVPFEVHIPGHRGFLQNRFITDIRLWRDPSVFAYDYRDIRTIDVNYTEDASRSFTLQFDGKQPALRIAGKSVQADSLALFAYMNEYRKITYEAIVTDETFPKATKDSILNSTPFVRIAVTDAKGKRNLFEGYRRKAQEGTANPDGTPRRFDLDRMYGYLNGKDFVLVQYFQFDRLLRDPNSFLAPAR